MVWHIGNFVGLYQNIKLSHHGSMEPWLSLSCICMQYTNNIIKGSVCTVNVTIMTEMYIVIVLLQRLKQSKTPTSPYISYRFVLVNLIHHPKWYRTKTYGYLLKKQ